jgi:ADP-dependent NAD(P)H-hydrate dehydratase / NAD(P)H-hydrate epimerase
VSAMGIREGEAQAILRQPKLDATMMDRAGKGLALAICGIANHLEPPDPVVRLIAGPGNNGGDVFAAAMFLDDMDMLPEVWLACSIDKLKGCAKAFFEQMVEAEIPFIQLATERDWDVIDEGVYPPPILVDGLLGTGAKGEPTGTVKRAVDYLRARSGKCVIVSADIPTGMDADSGEVARHAVCADFTVTMGFPKRGMASSQAQECLGSLRRVEIGLPDDVSEAIPDARPELQWISEADVRRAFPPRPRSAHKGSFGTALLMGGVRYPGAIVLAAEGAARSGAGLVRIATAAPAAAAILARLPEAIACADLAADVALGKVDSILAGPGLGCDAEARRLVARLLRETPVPLVLDADAISAFAGKPEALRECAQTVVITPHPGEMAALLGTDVASIQQNRLLAVREAAQRSGAIVVLKGAGTLVARHGGPAWMNLNGNPGMACGGCGDVLAGLLAGLLAQRIDPFDAACAAVWLHGAAGDVAALRKTQVAMGAGDVAQAIPAAFAQLGVK